MRHAGAVRIDHALGLNRLYLIPNGQAAERGAYVRFPFEAMLAVVSQESVRSRCLVIGEDLGTVPPGVPKRCKHGECGRIWWRCSNVARMAGSGSRNNTLKMPL
jgi:4-alpha-glucanotransferase